MPLHHTSETLQSLSIELKYTKKLLKLLTSFSSAPENYKPTLSRKIDYLQTKLETNDIKTLKKSRSMLEHKIEQLTKTQQRLSYTDHLSGWYLRALINHFDSSQKIQSLSSTTEGINALAQKPLLFVDKNYLRDKHKATVSQLNQFFKFKAYGKGSERSAELEKQFYSLFRFTSTNPIINTTIGDLGLPLFHYNTEHFWGQLKNDIPSTFVTGLCPLSTVSNEIGIKLTTGKLLRPNLGFEEFTDVHEDIETLVWPEKPILTDYLKLNTALELYLEHREYPNLSVIIWYPYHEYLLDLAENVFGRYIENGLLTYEQLVIGLDGLRKNYRRLFELVKRELGLTAVEFADRLEFREVINDRFNELEKFRKRANLSFFKYIYGSFIGNELRRELYEQLVIKHIFPTFTGQNVLHLDTSYELWVDILATILVERIKKYPKASYSWVCHPELPSISLSHMREYNAPYDDKLYLVENPRIFEKRVEKLPDKYLLHIAPIILGRNYVENIDEIEILGELRKRLIRLNELLMSD